MRTLCDLCESAAATLFCAADQAALCGSCDQKFPGDKGVSNDELGLQPIDQRAQNQQNRRIENPQRGVKIQQSNRSSTVLVPDNVNDGQHKMDTSLIDLNAQPQNINGQISND